MHISHYACIHLPASIDKYKTLPIGSSDETELDKMVRKRLCVVILYLNEILRSDWSFAGV